jgi:hypothetical protein
MNYSRKLSCRNNLSRRNCVALSQFPCYVITGDREEELLCRELAVVFIPKEKTTRNRQRTTQSGELSGTRCLLTRVSCPP